jgi:16S rRNA processing protein RimM
MILLAIIGAAHGIKGAVKVKAFTHIPTNILDYGPLQDEKGQKYILKLVRVASPDSLIMTVKGVEDRNQAEALRGIKLYVNRDQLPDPQEEEFYHSDLVGLKAQDLQGNAIGHVKAVSNFGAGDFLELVDSNHHLYTIPFTKEAVPLIQLTKSGIEGHVQVDRRFLLDSTASPKEENKDLEHTEEDMN